MQVQCECGVVLSIKWMGKYVTEVAAHECRKTQSHWQEEQKK